MSLFQELKRRNVFRVAFGYVVLAWLVLQVTDVVMPILTLPEWVARLVLFLLVIGFPFALFFAWAYELTPEGLRKEKHVDRSQSITHQTKGKLDRAIIGILVVAVGVLLFDRFAGTEAPRPAPAQTTPGSDPDGTTTSPQPVHGQDETGAQPSAEQSVAVLPFVNMSEDEENEYFSDGISEELLNVLVRIKGLRVPSRTSSFSFKGSDLRLSEIGRELGVDHVLEGSVRKAGNRIRVTAQLIDVETDTHLWSETYTRQLDDIFAVQDEIAQSIVAALRVTLTGEDERLLERRPTDNVEAYNQYLYGRHWWNQRIPGRMSEAVPPLHRAVELDPEFDRAWAALADAYLLLPEYNEGTVEEHIPRALVASRRALEINPQSAQALTTSAYIDAMYYYRWDTAEASFRKAIELAPDYVTAHQWYAETLSVLRRTDEAMAQLDQAAEIDPLAPIVRHIMGWVAKWDGRLDEAERHYLDALQLDPGFPYAISNLGIVHMLKGEYDQARARWEEYGELLDVDVSSTLLLIDGLADAEKQQQAIDAQISQPIPTQPFGAPVGLMLLGREDLALEMLLKSFEADGPYLPHVNRMFVFDPLREDPRFQAMLEKMNLWP